METELTRIAGIVKAKPKERFTSLAHLINARSLKECHREMEGNKAIGVDLVTKEGYEENLDANLADLVERMRRQAYQPQPVRRVYIPKPGTNKQRPLGIGAYEDKLVDSVLAKILNAIYEPDFLDCSYGFRPGRGCHDALKELNRIIEQRDINYIVDADIKGFFNHVDHNWLMEFLKVRIADPNILRLIARFLKAGVMEAGVRYDTPEGTPQGGVSSPILANIYLHYILDLWFDRVIRKTCKGEAYLVRYADDFLCCFQYEEDARAFYQLLIPRLAKFNLEIAEDKTRIIVFGRRAEQQGNSDTFDFLGFTHFCGRSKQGKFRVKRKTSIKKYKSSLLRCKEWLKRNRNVPAEILMEKLEGKLNGYYRYYGITDNYPSLIKYVQEVEKLLFKWMNRRSQRRSFKWDKFELFLDKFPLPEPRIFVNIYALKVKLRGCCR